MKKMVKIMALVTLVATMLSGCGNKDMFDTVYNFDRAIIKLADGTTVTGEVES